MRISSRLQSVTESTTMAIAARAAELRREGKNVISLSAGEPDFDTPPFVAQAGIDAIRGGQTHYTAAAGTPELRQQISLALARDRGLAYRPNEICVTAGTKPAVWLCLLALLEPGERCIVLAPFWVSYPAMVRLAGAEPVIVPCPEDNGFLPREEALERALQEPGVRGIIFNSPCNPTGAVWPRERVAGLVELCARYDVWIVSDEIYDTIHYGNTEIVCPAGLPGGRERTVSINGLSKAFAMTGWRLGWLAAPEPVVDAVLRIQSQAIGNACSISQAAALTALEAERDTATRGMVAAFQERRDFLVSALEELPGMTLHPPAGAFYAFPGVRRLLEARRVDDVRLCQSMLEEIGVAIVPGSAFGEPGHVRFSFAASLEDIREALSRLSDWLE